MKWYSRSVKCGLYFAWIFSLIFVIMGIILNNLKVDWQSLGFAKSLLIISGLILIFSLRSALVMSAVRDEVSKIIGNDNDIVLKQSILPLLKQAGIDERNVLVRSDKNDLVGAYALSMPIGKRSLIAFTTELLKIMPVGSDAFNAVAAHEISHIKNGDSSSKVFIRVFHDTLSAIPNYFAKPVWNWLRVYWGIPVLILSFLAVIQIYNSIFFGNINFLVAALIIFISSFLAFSALLEYSLESLVQYYSRIREFHADRGAALLTSPEAMIAALEIIPPYELAGASPFLKRFFESHPPTEARIHELRKPWVC